MSFELKVGLGDAESSMLVSTSIKRTLQSSRSLSREPHDDTDFRSVNDNLQHLQICRRKIWQLAIRLLPPSDATTQAIASARFPASLHVFPLLVGSEVWVVAVSSTQIPASRSLPRGEAEQHMIH
ncbi:hypothetical protein EUGRSUZ_B03336 [Eucalyptus grandis]|uniref:Uncharacterized protein n=2 Tax=Eucalyptus grandis TaxID=71139 RepID=A0ACC3LWX6_EUCGR|nr:hypothetical protein EUGRSUZ_B03336 [Eucalyptus grandis]